MNIKKYLNQYLMLRITRLGYAREIVTARAPREALPEKLRKIADQIEQENEILKKCHDAKNELR